MSLFDKETWTDPVRRKELLLPAGIVAVTILIIMVLLFAPAFAAILKKAV